MRNSGKFKARLQRKQQIGQKALDIMAKYGPKEEDNEGFKLPKPRRPLKRDLSPENERDPTEHQRSAETDKDNDKGEGQNADVPTDFGRKYRAVEDTGLHNKHIRASFDVPQEQPADDDDGMLVGPPIPAFLTQSTSKPAPTPPKAAASSQSQSPGRTQPHTEVQSSSSKPNPNPNPNEDYVREGVELPISHIVGLKGHNKGVTAVAIDAVGNRLVTGGNDYQVCMYDFQGMNERLRPFRTIQPADGYPVSSLSFK
jgi:hypothetical protein